MAGHQTYEEGKTLVFKGLILLAFITIVEVIIALAAKGHILGIPAFGKSAIGGPIYGLIMVGASLYKAYFIVFKFMHMGFEVRGLMFTVLMPMLLLVWAVIAFFHEGSMWGASREHIKTKNLETVAPNAAPKKEGTYYLPHSIPNRF
jgi:cytochrome c oxidase subunit IV